MTVFANAYRNQFDVPSHAADQTCKGCRYDRRDGPESMATLRPTQLCTLPNNPRLLADQRCGHYQETPP